MTFDGNWMIKIKVTKPLRFEWLISYVSYYCATRDIDKILSSCIQSTQTTKHQTDIYILMVYDI